MLLIMLMVQVALRKESVDRNQMLHQVRHMQNWSLSARRAWIEIDIPPNLDADHAVALRKESVDRNFDTMQIVIVIMRRSPQGERG